MKTWIAKAVSISCVLIMIITSAVVMIGADRQNESSQAHTSWVWLPVASTWVWCSNVTAYSGDDANWIDSSGGHTHPTTGSRVVFNATGTGSCTWNSTWTLGSFSMLPGYTGTVTVAGSKSWATGVDGNITLSAGTFTLAYPTNTTITCAGYFTETANVLTSGKLNVKMTRPGTTFTKYINANLYKFETGISINMDFFGTGIRINNLVIGSGGSLHLIDTLSTPLTIPLYIGDYSYSNLGIIDSTGTSYVMFDIYDASQTITFGTINCPVQIVKNSAGVTGSRTATLGANTVFVSDLTVYSSHATETMTLDLSTNNYSLTATNIRIGTRGIINMRNSDITTDGWNSAIGSFTRGTSTVIFQGNVGDVILGVGQVFHNLELKANSYTLFNQTTKIDGGLNAFGDWSGMIEIQDENEPVTIHNNLNGYLSSISGITINGDDYQLTTTPDSGGLEYYGLSFNTSIDEIPTATMPSSMVCIGDSLVAAAFTTQLSSITGVTVVNSGVGGQQTGPMLARFAADVVALHPEWVYIMGGANDVVFSINPLTTQANLRSMYNMSITAGIKVIAATITPNIASFTTPAMQAAQNSTNSWIRNQSSDDILVVDMENLMLNPINVLGLNPRYDSGDHIHPNAKGYQRMANYIISEILRLDPQPGTGSMSFRLKLMTSDSANFTLSGLNVSTAYQVNVDGVSEINYLEADNTGIITFRHTDYWDTHTIDIVKVTSTSELLSLMVIIVFIMAIVGMIPAMLMRKS